MSEFSPGLEGVLAAKTEISMVDGQNGRLVYRGGYTISDLYENCTFEEIAHLLWFGELPTEGELEDTKRRLAAKRASTNLPRRPSRRCRATPTRWTSFAP